MAGLFDPFTLRSLTLRNRIGISPMCMYSARDGVPNDWHLVHLGGRAAGGSGLIFTEATAVEPRGRISDADTGLWNAEQAEAWSRIVRFVKGQGAAIGVQLAHAGRKASTAPPWEDRGAPLRDGHRAWQPIGPSAVAFDDKHATPAAMTLADISTVIREFGEAARRAVDVGFDTVEVHAAHGYLLHNFYSPLSNRRTDAYGGSFENRTRLLREVVEGVREAIADSMPLFVRLSCSDWTEGGWTIEESVALARDLRGLGVDAIDCSSGGNVPKAKIPVGPGYQVPFAERVRREADVATAAVGMILDPAQADSIVREGKADLVLIARESLRDPNFALRAARELGADSTPARSIAPRQYERAWA
jgi:2,4-dienoyl-CoA reductase-like NADH-dependent reductase (Old Yellow Enzyme family)